MRVFSLFERVFLFNEKLWTWAIHATTKRIDKISNVKFQYMLFQITKTKFKTHYKKYIPKNTVWSRCIGNQNTPLVILKLLLVTILMIKVISFIYYQWGNKGFEKAMLCLRVCYIVNIVQASIIDHLIIISYQWLTLLYRKKWFSFSNQCLDSRDSRPTTGLNILLQYLLIGLVLANTVLYW